MFIFNPNGMKWTVSRKMADSYMEKRNELNEQILHCRSELSKIFPAVLVQSIYAKIQDANSKLFNHLQQIKAQKVDQLIGPQIIRDSSPEIRKTAVTIPEKPNWISNPWVFFLQTENLLPKKRKSANWYRDQNQKPSFSAQKLKTWSKKMAPKPKTSKPSLVRGVSSCNAALMGE